MWMEICMMVFFPCPPSKYLSLDSPLKTQNTDQVWKVYMLPNTTSDVNFRKTFQQKWKKLLQ